MTLMTSGYVPSIGPTTPDRCDHDRLTCPECIDTCRVCGWTATDGEELAAHVAAEHEISPDYDCPHCGRPSGH